MAGLSDRTGEVAAAGAGAGATQWPGIAEASPVVVKVGSSSLTTARGGIDEDRIAALADALAARTRGGGQVVLVSSGAIAAGLAPLGLPRRPRDLATQQAAASVGQGLLVARYTAAFARHGVRTGQVLLSADDLMRRAHYRNAQRTLSRLLELGILPIVNENDTVATDEIRFGDNDRLAALVAHVVRAGALILLSDVDALYDTDPRQPGARRITEVRSRADLAGVTLGRVGAGGSAVAGRGRGRGRGRHGPGRHGRDGHQGGRRHDRDRGGDPDRGGQRRRGPGGPGGAAAWDLLRARRRGGRPGPGSCGWPTRPPATAGCCWTRARPRPSRAAARRCCPPGSPAWRAGSTRATRLTCVLRTAGSSPGAWSTTTRPRSRAMMGRSTHELAAQRGPEYEREIVHRDDLVLLRTSRCGQCQRR